MSFRIKGLPAEHFSHLFALPDEELAKRQAVRRIADDRQPGYPCRVSRTATPSRATSYCLSTTSTYQLTRPTGCVLHLRARGR